MTLTTKDAIYIADLINQIDAVLGEYDETPHDQIDNLRWKTAEIIEMLGTQSEYEPSMQDLANEELQLEYSKLYK